MRHFRPRGRHTTGSLIVSLKLNAIAKLRLFGIAYMLLSITSTLSTPQTSSQDRLAAQKQDGQLFTPVLKRLNAQLDTLQQPELGNSDRYNAADVNLVLTNTKRDIVSQIPADDLPLSAYVGSRLPSTFDTSKPFVSREDGDARFTILKGLLTKLTAMPSFRLNMRIITRPPKAAFDLLSASGTHISTTTDDELTNVFRGEYEYSISKSGYKSVHSRIDLVDRTGTTLSCELLTDSDPQTAFPCTFR